MISKEELGAILKSLVISNQNTTTIERLQKEFRENEGYQIPLCGYCSLQDLLVNGLSNAVTVNLCNLILRAKTTYIYLKVYGRGPNAIVAAVVNSKTQHMYDLVTEQRTSRTRKRPPKKSYRSHFASQQNPSYTPSYRAIRGPSANHFASQQKSSYAPSYRAIRGSPASFNQTQHNRDYTATGCRPIWGNLSQRSPPNHSQENWRNTSAFKHENNGVRGS